MLGKVQARWNDVEFNVIPYKDVKDVFMLGSIEDIQVRWLPNFLFPLSSIFWNSPFLFSPVLSCGLNCTHHHV